MIQCNSTAHCRIQTFYLAGLTRNTNPSEARPGKQCIGYAIGFIAYYHDGFIRRQHMPYIFTGTGTIQQINFPPRLMKKSQTFRQVR